MVKIKAKKDSVKNSKLIVPFDGLITIDGNGTVEVSEKCAEQLLTIEDDWEKVCETADEQNDETTAEDFEKKVKGMTVAELQDMCKEAGLPEEEWEGLKKKELVSYVVEKFNNDEEVEEEPEDEVED